MKKDLSFVTYQKVFLVVNIIYLQVILLCWYFYLMQRGKTILYSHNLDNLFVLSKRYDIFLIYMNLSILNPDIEVIDSVSILLIKNKLYSCYCTSLYTYCGSFANYSSTIELSSNKIYNINRALLFQNISKIKLNFFIFKLIFQSYSLADLFEWFNIV